MHTCAVVVRGETGSSRRRRGRLWKRLRREKEKERERERCGVKSFEDWMEEEGGIYAWVERERERERSERGKGEGMRGRGEERKDEANVSPGVGISGRCATALPGSHLWGQSPPSMGPRPCPRKATALRHDPGPTTAAYASLSPLSILASSLPKAISRSIAREKNR